jgi:hypothetical protein
VTTLSHRLRIFAGSTRTGPGPESCDFTPLALATALDAQHPQAARLSPHVCGVPGIAGRADDSGEAPGVVPPPDAA